uniref:Ig-like domain-containing protein n=1 Tax=Xenopus tropicalis TaxID=8364 RepID=B4F709_XENTR|nr:uncharacterized protein LOC100216128 precursor [Xenopus tropicalis]AAI68086.1 Unknown (protein for MGC:185925) [Xenopus tropicalis]|eukprot:NP_001135579.1 uncharacterized protein LOC100216128 precursor [Xenopus tropicalis]
MGVRRFWFSWKYHIILLSILSVQWKGRNCQEQTEAVPGFKIEAPAEVRVQKGLCVRIPCNFTVGPGFTLTRDAIGIWYKGYNGNFEDEIVAASTDSSRFPDTTNGRFIFTGKVSAGDCSFSISDAQSGDAAQYQFRVEDKAPLKFTYIGIKPSVSVTEPDISQTKGLIAGEEVTLTCTAPTNCPGLSPTFTWEGSVNTERTQSHTLQHQDGNFSYWSNITFTPSPKDHNSSLTCTVTYRNVSTNTSIIFTLNVEYLPILKITLPGGTGESSSLIMREGDSQEIYCTVDSNPLANFSWTKGKSPVENTKQNGQNLTLSLRNVTENDTAVYTCTAQNQRGSNNRSITVSFETAQKPQTNFLIVGLCILFFTLVAITAVFVFRWMRKKKDLQKDNTAKEMPTSDGDVIYNNIGNMGSFTNESFMDTEKDEQDKVQYASLSFSTIKPKEAPQTEDIIYSEVKRN